jgi:hypothetical protein
MDNLGDEPVTEINNGDAPETPKRKVDFYLGYLHMLRSLQDYYKQRMWRKSVESGVDLEEIIDRIQPISKKMLPVSLAKMAISSKAMPFKVSRAVGAAKSSSSSGSSWNMFG